MQLCCATTKVWPDKKIVVNGKMVMSQELPFDTYLFEYLHRLNHQGRAHGKGILIVVIVIISSAIIRDPTTVWLWLNAWRV